MYSYHIRAHKQLYLIKLVLDNEVRQSTLILGDRLFNSRVKRLGMLPLPLSSLPPSVGG
jgi:hypothetical protein